MSKFIVVKTSENDLPQINTHETLEKAANDLKRTVREDTYYRSTYTMHKMNEDGSTERIHGWAISYEDGMFYNIDTQVNVDCGDTPKGSKFSARTLAPLFANLD